MEFTMRPYATSEELPKEAPSTEKKNAAIKRRNSDVASQQKLQKLWDEEKKVDFCVTSVIMSKIHYNLS